MATKALGNNHWLMLNTMASPCPTAFNTTQYFLIPVYSVVVGAGLPLNCLALWILVSQINKSIILSVYMLNLGVADLLQTLMLPFWIYYSYWDHNWDLGSGACVAVSLGFITNFYAKNGFLCLIAMERYIGILRKEPEAGRCYEGYPLGTYYASFKMATMALSFFLPCFFMGFFYLRILHKLRQLPSLEQETKRQIYSFISLINICFFLLCVTYQVTSFYKYQREMVQNNEGLCLFETNLFIYSQAALCLTTLGSDLDPLLYILLLKDMRTELGNHLKCNVLGQGQK
ncbi:probable G-protein coupled receptor 132 [Dermochelys coriacea]|uniref:probable G-protein coupled receptor 132 n=1 Tax=Dermochelys coriacea TaxID=27794 RepID=UPI0018E714F4|nr:probable G-protein coupled receptor 132 [Dermochelys coriacea]